jgi:hypothetical protein
VRHTQPHACDAASHASSLRRKPRVRLCVPHALCWRTQTRVRPRVHARRACRTRVRALFAGVRARFACVRCSGTRPSDEWRAKGSESSDDDTACISSFKNDVLYINRREYVQLVAPQLTRSCNAVRGLRACGATATACGRRSRRCAARRGSMHASARERTRACGGMQTRVCVRARACGGGG